MDICTGDECTLVAGILIGGLACRDIVQCKRDTTPSSWSPVRPEIIGHCSADSRDQAVSMVWIGGQTIAAGDGRRDQQAPDG